jgi:predicted O-methyltransferase YrrM
VEHQAWVVLERIYEGDAAQRAANMPSSERTRNLGRQSGVFLNLLAKSLVARRVLEIGSSNGASTIWLADAMRETGGTVVGTELIPERAGEANENLAAAGLASHAQVLAGDVRTHIRDLSGPFDLVFIDAEKDDYVEHFTAVIDKVRPGGVVLADNVISHDLSAYQSMLRNRSDVESVTLAHDRGIEYTVKCTVKKSE